MAQESPESTSESIAIIGMSCLFPDARTPTTFWNNLCAGKHSFREFSDEQIRHAGGDPANRNKDNFVSCGVLLEGIDEFDAEFFGFSPRDAELLDPQHRKFLECAWWAMEDAGYDTSRCKDLIGIFGGADFPTYMLNVFSNADVIRSVGSFAAVLANDKDYLATRVAYLLNLRGPAMTIQTACSTSLVAICQACQSLLHFQCDMALAGGSAISATQGAGYFWKEGGINSPDGFCRTFDENASGTVSGSGVGIVVLKRLDEAIVDGDHIYATIRGFGLNNDGHNKIGYTAPSVDGQAQAILSALMMAEVSADTIDYVECHGTATPLGDPIEIAALNDVFKRHSKRKQFCGVGSVKTNIGHLSSAAGVAGVIKTALALKHKTIPPSLHFEQGNHEIAFETGPLFVVDEITDWKSDTRPRRAGVSSFGIGGTNAHLILEEPPPRPASVPVRPWTVLPLSAKTSHALETMSENLARWSTDNGNEAAVPDVAYTLQKGRTEFDHRQAFVLDANSNLDQAQLERVTFKSCNPAKEPLRVAFLFPGQGAQFVNMGRSLYKSEPLVHSQLDYCFDYLDHRCGMKLRQILFPETNGEEDAASRLRKTEVLQPALFVIEYTLAQLWMSWGVTPAVLVGHSLGEYVAACIAGVFSLDDALELVVERGRLMQSVQPGAMIAVHCGSQTINDMSDAAISIAAENGSSCVASGSIAAIESLESRLAAANVVYTRLETSHAFHSSSMDEIKTQFIEHLRRISLSPPKMRILSNFTGTWLDADSATSPEYWANHLRHTVQFAANLQALDEDGVTAFLEVGPGSTLTSLARRFFSSHDRSLFLKSLPARRDEVPVNRQLMENVASLWVNGAEINWDAIHEGEARRRIPLPTYPFDRKRFWIETSHPAKSFDQMNGHRPQSSRGLSEWFYTSVWKPTTVRATDSPPRSCLFICDDIAWSSRLIQRFRTQGTDIRVARVSAEMHASCPSGVAVDLFDPESWNRLFRRLIDDGHSPERVVFSFNGTNVSDADVDSSSQNDDLRQNSAFFAFLHLVQAIARTLPGHPIDLIALTTSGVAISPHERPNPEQAMLSGAVNVVAQEFPGIRCRLIDVPETLAPGILDLVNTAIQSESAINFLAIRESGSWHPTYVPAELHPETAQRFRRHDGVYVVTGGLGGIGYTLSKQLATWGQVKLILISRTRLPDRADWGCWLKEHDDADTISQKIRRVQEIESIGAEVFIESADVADASTMKRLVTKISERIGTVRGVIHSAGMPGGGIIELKSAQQAVRVIEAKTRGTQNVFDAFGGESLDFFILCSSLSSIIGGYGQIDYCAANCFLDAFAFQHSSSKSRVVAVNWDVWKDIGMAAEAATLNGRSSPHASVAGDGISAVDGAEILDYILSSTQSQLIVSTTDLNERLEGSRNEMNITAVAAGNGARSRTHVRPPLSSSFQRPTASTEAALAELWSRTLGYSPVGATDNFLDAGGHSLLAVEMLARVRKEFSTAIPIADFIKNPTVSALSEMIDKARDSSETQNETFDRILRLRSTGTLPPLFCMHPVGGLSWTYVGIVNEIDANRPVYAIQDEGIAPGGQMASSIESVAKRVVELIRSVQPVGPYNLLGWSFGGIVAHEAACLLQDAGQAVELLALLDSFPSKLVDSPRLEVTIDVSEQELEAARREHAEFRDLSDDDLKRIIRVLQNNTSLLSHFKPRCFVGDILFFRATESADEMSVNEHWKQYISGNVSHWDVPCRHSNMTASTPSKTIGRILNQHLTRINDVN